MASKKATFQDTDLYIDAFKGSKEVLLLPSEMQPLPIMRPADTSLLLFKNLFQKGFLWQLTLQEKWKCMLTHWLKQKNTLEARK